MDYFPDSKLTKKAFASNRRKFIRHSGGLAAALGAFSTTLHARDKNSKNQIDAVVLFRWENKHSATFAKSLSEEGLQAIALREDPVRQWRDNIGKIIADRKNPAPLIGLTNWSDFLIVRELASEARKFPVVEVQLGSNQYNRPNILSQYSTQLLAVAASPKNKQLHNKVNRLSSNNKQSQSLFAWVIV